MPSSSQDESETFPSIFSSPSSSSLTRCPHAPVHKPCAIDMRATDIKSRLRTLLKASHHFTSTQSKSHNRTIHHRNIIMLSIPFITHVRKHLHNALRDAVVQKAPNHLRPILSDVDTDIRQRANIIGAKYWVRVPCSSKQWAAFSNCFAASSLMVTFI